MLDSQHKEGQRFGKWLEKILLLICFAKLCHRDILQSTLFELNENHFKMHPDLMPLPVAYLIRKSPLWCSRS